MMQCWLCALYWILLMNSQGLTSSCPAGEKKSDNLCVPCEKGTFKDAEFKYETYCLACDICREGTKESSPCTATSNTVCTCLEGFTRRHLTACDCNIGSGFDSTGKKCMKCETGFFNDKKDAESKCQRWKDCGHLGVKVKGNATSDVICNTATSFPDPQMKTSTPVATVSIATTVILPRVNSTSNVPSLPFFTQSKATTAPASHYYNGMVALLITAFILLILCFALIFKLATGLCLKRLKKPIIRAETVCRTPVEESGDKSCSSLVSSTDSSQIIEDV